MKPAAFTYARPKDWSDALKLLGGGARPGAGTQSLGPLLNLRLAQPDTIADLRHLPGYAVVGVAGCVPEVLDDELSVNRVALELLIRVERCDLLG